MIHTPTTMLLTSHKRDDAADSPLRLQRVLVGVDFNSTSLAAARWVARHFASEAELALAHVIALPQVPSFLRRAVPRPRALLQQIAPQVRGGLRGLARTLGAGSPHTELLVGIPSERLAACAEDFGADMVVVGRTGQRAGTWKRIGSTADRLIRQVRVPVLIATGALTEPPRRILAAVDDGDIGHELLRASQSLAMRFGAELIAMHVLSERMRAYAVAGVPVITDVAALHASADRDIRGAAEEWLGDALRDVGATDAAHVEIRIGDAGHEILAAAEQLDVDLIIIGSYGSDAVARNGTGGVTRFVVRGTRRPVLVVGNGPVTRLTIEPPGRFGIKNVMPQRRSAATSIRNDTGPLPAAVRSRA